MGISKLHEQTHKEKKQQISATGHGSVAPFTNMV